MHSSYSALSTFALCPLKYKYQHIDKIKSPPSPAQIFGSTIHDVMKFIHTPTVKGLPDEEKTLDYFSRNWEQKNFPEEVSQNLFQEGLEIIQKYFQTIEKEERKKAITLEYRFVVPIQNHTLGGSIDRIDRIAEGFEIIDYKTNRKIPPQKEIDQDLQLSIYLKAFLKEWPSLFEKIQDTTKIKLSLFYLRHGLRLSTTRTPANLKQIEQDILKAITEVEKATENKNFEPRMNALCDWCDYQKICPFWSHKFKKAENKKQEQDIRQLSEKFIALKVQKSQLEKEIMQISKELSAYLEQEKIGQFFTDQGNILRNLRETYRYDAGKVADILKQWNQDPFSVMKVDGVALRRLSSKLSPDQKYTLTSLKELDKKSYYLTVKK